MDKFKKGDKALIRVSQERWVPCEVIGVAGVTLRIETETGHRLSTLPSALKDYNKEAHDKRVGWEGDWEKMTGEVGIKLVIQMMEQAVIYTLSDLDNGYGYRKSSISKKTGIPEDILTVILKRLKQAGRVELIMIFNEETGMADGSGYALTKNERQNHKA